MADAPLSVWSAPVSIGARAVLLFLWRCARADRPTAWPSQSLIVDVTGQHPRTVQKQLRELREAGLIEAAGTVGRGVIVWRLTPGHIAASDSTPGHIAGPPPAISPPPTLVGSPKEAQPNGDEEDDHHETASISHISDAPNLREKRRIAAIKIWEAHEQRCVDREIGRAARGGGLRRPSKKDINAIIRCASQLRTQENLEERRAWLILRDAAVAAVDRAADARDEGDDFAEKLCMWRRRDPFGGKKLGAMLDELDRKIRAERAASRNREGANVQSEDRRRELEERAKAQRFRMRAVGDFEVNDGKTDTE